MKKYLVTLVRKNPTQQPKQLTGYVDANSEHEALLKAKKLYGQFDPISAIEVAALTNIRFNKKRGIT